MSQKTSPQYQNIVISKKEGSMVTISGSIPADVFDSFRSKAVANINNTVTIDGFRKGNIPEKILVSKVGEMTILEEMAELSLQSAYPDIIIDNKIDAIGSPDIQIKKIAAGNPLEFEINTAVVPEVTLPDYKSIAKSANSSKETIKEVTDKDVEDTILRIRRSRVDHSSHEHKEGMTDDEHNALVDSQLPEFNDVFVQSLGDFKDVEDFKKKIKVTIKSQRERDAIEKLRIQISDKMIDETKIEVPKVMIDSELKRIEAQFSDDIARMGVSFDDYLKHAKKTIEEIRKEWEPSAKKKVQLQLILNAIAEKEKITPSTEEIEAEVNHIVEHYADADRERAHVYAETVLTNEKVYEMLTSVK
jgi:trigger factor